MMELINSGFYNLEDLGLSFMLFVDEVEVWKKTAHPNVCMVYLCLNETPARQRFLKENLLPIGSFHTRGKYNPSIFSPFTTMFQFAFFKPPELMFSHYELMEDSVTMSSFTPKAKCVLLGMIFGELSNKLP